MPRTTTTTRLSRYRYEIAAAILLTMLALSMLAVAAFSNDSTGKGFAKVTTQHPVERR